MSNLKELTAWRNHFKAMSENKIVTPHDGIYRLYHQHGDGDPTIHAKTRVISPLEGVLDQAKFESRLDESQNLPNRIEKIKSIIIKKKKSIKRKKTIKRKKKQSNAQSTPRHRRRRTKKSR
jgi:hypothetical protein